MAGLIQIAEHLNIMRQGKPLGSASLLIEHIGLFNFIVESVNPQSIGYVDIDGLSERDCFTLGQEHYNKKEPPHFTGTALSGLRKRDACFIRAYARGYMSTFIDDELEIHTSPLQTLLQNLD